LAHKIESSYTGESAQLKLKLLGKPASSTCNTGSAAVDESFLHEATIDTSSNELPSNSNTVLK
jgi:hypothetical protein